MNNGRISLGMKLGKNTMSSNQSLSCAITVQEHCSLMGGGYVIQH